MLAHAGAADESLSVAMLTAALWVGWIGWTRLRGRGFARVPRWGAGGLLGAAAVIAVASAFVPRAILGPRPSSGPRIASTAQLAFRAPTEGEIVTGDQLRVVLDLQDATVMDTTTGPVTADTGHLHLSVDGTLVSMTYGTVQVVDLRPLDAGMHTITAEFVAADHLSFSPKVVATVRIDRRFAP